MKVLYHDDPDGQCSAFSIKHFLGTKSVPDDSGEHGLEFLNVDHGSFDCDAWLSSVKNGEIVWIVDFAIEPDKMEELLEKTPNVTWIDHHKTSMDDYKNFSKDIKGIRWTKYAACVLTYMYIYCNNKGDVSEKALEACKVPRFIELLGDRDAWTWAFGEETALFMNGSCCYDRDPAGEFWENLMKGDGETGFIKEVMRKGKTVTQFKQRFFEDARRNVGYETEFAGHKCAVVNMPNTGSEALGGEGAEYGELRPGYDVLIRVEYNGEEFSVSLYSKKVDVSVICKEHGGGGHPGASGFSCDKLPFDKTGDLEE